MKLRSCDNCGVVVDLDVVSLGHEEAFSHDQDKKCDAVKCPVCNGLILTEEWESV